MPDDVLTDVERLAVEEAHRDSRTIKSDYLARIIDRLAESVRALTEERDEQGKRLRDIADDTGLVSPGGYSTFTLMRQAILLALEDRAEAARGRDDGR